MGSVCPYIGQCDEILDAGPCRYRLCNNGYNSCIFYLEEEKRQKELEEIGYWCWWMNQPSEYSSSTG
ncbi:MAG: hypothetical protein ABIF08_04065 [Nanoarchaeota archaeon]